MRKKKKVRTKTFEPVYSGPNSSAFWNAINLLPTSERGDLYEIGCLLQDAEYKALLLLNKRVKNDR